MIENDILIKVSWLYYFDNKTQSEISKILNISRQKVQRLLAKAREKEIVKIRLSNPAYNLISLEKELKEKFNLEDAVVVPTVEKGEDLKRDLVKGLANYLYPLLSKVSILGIGSGSTICYLHEYLDSNVNLKKDFKIVSLFGTLFRNSSSNPYIIGTRIAEKLNRPFYGLWSPYLSNNIESAKMIREQEMIKRTFDFIKNVDISIVGIGGAVDVNSLYFKYGTLSIEEIKELCKRNSVGDILGHWYDINGKMVWEEMNEKYISANVKTPGKTIGVSGGENKVKGIRGALAGNYIDVLVIDEETAKKVISM
ncbi:MAG: hypothetical protein PWQ77_2200 [Kosmotogales bacterium]|nr:hypothetical protein [Kosmotogales bacterium]